MGVPKSTYYRWLRRKEQQGLEDDVGASTPPWNKLASQEIDSVLTAAREMPELSCRQLAAWTTDNMGFSVSESTVYRILRREGLVKRPEMQLAAGKEYHRKTTGPHQMWATDASYFRVVGWGYYYMVTVMDDYSRFILAHRLQRDMTSDSFIEVVQEAVDRTGMDQIPTNISSGRCARPSVGRPNWATSLCPCPMVITRIPACLSNRRRPRSEKPC